ncbi:Uncharacterized protein Adt_39585 [Abeliophyllum distichum]|uniref:Uncharacterized protein n=1 Tax=Abeliophyllum distichum TaxID=126358 RepID=A0ABD1Q6F1_9LAMI
MADFEIDKDDLLLEDLWKPPMKQNFCPYSYTYNQDWQNYSDYSLYNNQGQPGMHGVDINSLILTKLDSLAKKMETLKYSQSANIVQMSLPICATCGANHKSSECLLATAEASSPEQATYAQNFQLQQNNPYSQTYNPGWKNHQNFLYDNTRNIQNPLNQERSQESKEEWKALDQSIKATEKRIENKIQQMIKMLTESPPGTIPSDTKATPMEDMSSITTMSKEQLPKILEYRPIVQIEESPTKEEEHVENEKLIINKQNEKVIFNDAEPINQFSDFHLSSKIDFVINAIDELEIFIVEFRPG